MNPTISLLHLLNFCAPAAALSLMLTLGRWLFARRTQALLPWYGQLALHFLVGIVALFIALVLWGRDGTMAGYMLLIAALATSQWVLLRGWK